MKKINKLLKALRLVAGKPSLLNLVLSDEDVNREAVIKKYGLTEGIPVADIRQFIDGAETVSPYSFTHGGSSVTDLALLKALAKKFPHCSYFEIGTWMGESVANVASVAEQCITLNLPDEKMRQMGLDEKYIGLHRFFSGALSNVIHLQGDSLLFDFKNFNKKFDLVFIDGDHHYEAVKSDTQNAFNLLKNKNSVIVWHDYGNTPADIRWEVLHGILDGVPAEKRKHLCRVSNTLCAVYCEWPLLTGKPPVFTTPDKNFEMDIRITSVNGQDH